MSKGRVLIVEDEAITAMDEQMTVESSGYEVVGIVDSGEGAVEAARDLKPDVILMDITLKGDMDGMEAAWKIRERFGIPVVFVTARGNKRIYDAAHYSEEATGYIIKPFDRDKLDRNLEAALAGELSPPDNWKPMS
ncbi:MAG: response regulator [Alphaproteobacteria bacterium]|nr:response regulator [Alphaproteobacteria bacterium]